LETENQTEYKLNKRENSRWIFIPKQYGPLSIIILTENLKIPLYNYQELKEKLNEHFKPKENELKTSNDTLNINESQDISLDKSGDLEHPLEKQKRKKIKTKFLLTIRIYRRTHSLLSIAIQRLPKSHEHTIYRIITRLGRSLILGTRKISRKRL